MAHLLQRHDLAERGRIGRCGRTSRVFVLVHLRLGGGGRQRQRSCACESNGAAAGYHAGLRWFAGRETVSEDGSRGKRKLTYASPPGGSAVGEYSVPKVPAD